MLAGRVDAGRLDAGRVVDRFGSEDWPQELRPELPEDRVLLRLPSFEPSKARQIVVGCREALVASSPLSSVPALLVSKRPPAALLLMADEAQMGVRCATTTCVPPSKPSPYPHVPNPALPP